MRLLIAIPHFYEGADAKSVNRSRRPEARDERSRALVATIAALHQTFGSGVYGLDHFHRIARQAAFGTRNTIDIVICTVGAAHLLDQIPLLRPLYRHRTTKADPAMLGFECHKVLHEAMGRYDFYGYVEDDIVVVDSLFFRKRALFDRSFGPEVLLQPNRYEVNPGGPVQKLYVDYNLAPARTEAYQDISDRPRLAIPFLDDTITFERTNYPSAGCFFLSAEQLQRWTSSAHFLDGDVSYLSPLDSAATLSIMKTFRIYKPILDQAWFLEVLHASPRWLPAVLPQIRLERCGG